MKLVTKYILTKYLKYFLIIFISLEIFFVGFDYIWNINDLPNSANLQLLYIIYTFIYLSNITFPLSLLFGFVVAFAFLTKENILVSFYSLGISKIKVINPIIFMILFLILLFITLQTTNLAYSKEKREQILNGKFFATQKNNIFLKYQDNFIYFKKLYPFEKKALDIHIFEVKNNQLINTIIAKKAYYQKDRWYIIDAKIIKKPKNIDWDKSKLNINYEKFLYTLNGFKPKIINNVYNANVEYSIYDAIYTFFLFNEQNLNTNKIRAIIYSKIFMPFFVIPMIIFLFFQIPASNRFFKFGQFISIGILASLIIWGIMFFLQKLAISNIINAELGIILPLFILFLISFYRLKEL